MSGQASPPIDLRQTITGPQNEGGQRLEIPQRLWKPFQTARRMIFSALDMQKRQTRQISCFGRACMSATVVIICVYRVLCESVDLEARGSLPARHSRC